MYSFFHGFRRLVDDNKQVLNLPYRDKISSQTKVDHLPVRKNESQLLWIIHITDRQMLGSILSSLLQSFVSSAVNEDLSQTILSILGQGFHYGESVIVSP